MPYARFDDVLDFLSKSDLNVFTVRDVAKVMRKPSGYVSLLLSKNRKVKRIENGRYYIEGTGMYEIASKIVYPSYVSLSAALQYYELIDQNVIRYSVISVKRHRPIGLEGGEIEFIKVGRERLFGYSYYDSAYLPSLEKLFVDCLYFNSPSFSQTEASFGSALEDRKVDIGLLKHYAIRMKSKALINKVGFLLELHGMGADDLLPYRYTAKQVKVVRDVKGKNKKWGVSYDR